MAILCALFTALLYSILSARSRLGRGSPPRCVANLDTSRSPSIRRASVTALSSARPVFSQSALLAARDMMHLTLKGIVHKQPHGNLRAKREIRERSSRPTIYGIAAPLMQCLVRGPCQATLSWAGCNHRLEHCAASLKQALLFRFASRARRVPRNDGRRRARRVNERILHERGASTSFAPFPSPSEHSETTSTVSRLLALECKTRRQS